MHRPFQSLASLAEARAALDSLLLANLGTEEVPLTEAHGRILAGELRASSDVPAFDRSAMDGFAVRSADAVGATREKPRLLRVTSTTHAGDPQQVLSPGEAAQIATGGILPRGADAVVPIERIVSDRTASEAAHPAGGRSIGVSEPARAGEHVSPKASDFAAGESLVGSGARIDAGVIGLLSSVGLTHVRIVRKPRVLIVPSGSEVVEPGAPLRPGQVYNSNAPAIAALARAAGADATALRPVPDEAGPYREALLAAASRADLLVTTGGSSVGERDLLAEFVEREGRTLIHGIRLRPGKPILIGAISLGGAMPGGRPRDVPLLGLPGYPASALVTADLFLAPAIRRLLARAAIAAGDRPTAHAAADPAPASLFPPVQHHCIWGHPVAARGDVTTIVPVAVADGIATSTYKESGTLTSVTRSDGFVVVPEGSSSIAKGDPAEVRPWSWRSHS
ncbi:MAG: molybdopterin molybdotransferase MoeA [Thermoplasmatota archaeon]